MLIFQQWNIPGPLKEDFIFDTPCGPTRECIDKLKKIEESPLDFFNLFLDDEVLNLICRETNRYANQTVVNRIVHKDIGPHARLTTWTDVTIEELKTFFGILIFMSINSLPNMTDYWSRAKIYRNPISEKMLRIVFN